MPAPTILGAFAHPDDETSCFAALMKRYSAEGKDIHIITATKGEMGALGTGDVVIKREDLPAVPVAGQHTVLQMLGVTNPPNYLGYRDGDHAAGAAGRHHRVWPHRALGSRRPHRHAPRNAGGLRTLPQDRHQRGDYYFWALEKRIIDEFDLTVDGIEVDPHVTIDVSATWASKVQALRMYASQEDAQEIADMMEMFDDRNEVFHQIFPPVPASARFDDLFHA